MHNLRCSTACLIIMCFTTSNHPSVNDDVYHHKLMRQAISIYSWAMEKLSFARKSKNALLNPSLKFKEHPKKSPHCKAFGDYSYSFNITVKSWGEGAYYSVGKFCSISDSLTIFLGGNHRVDWISTYPFPAFVEQFPEARNIKGHPATKGNVIIENDVWIGSHVTILSGVTIGDGAVVGAYSVVAKDIPPYAIAVGNPARIIRYRFDEKTREQLLKIAWWNWPIHKIRAHVHLLCDNNVQRFIAV